MNKSLKRFSGICIMIAGVLEIAVGYMEGRTTDLLVGAVCCAVGVIYLWDRKKK